MMTLRILLLASLIGLFFLPTSAFACSMNLPFSFIMPLLPRVDADCSLIGYEVNPTAIVIIGIFGIGLYWLGKTKFSEHKLSKK